MDTVEIGKILKNTRREKKITAKKLALKSGVSAKQISFIENGHVKNSRFQTILDLISSIGLELRLDITPKKGGIIGAAGGRDDDKNNP